MQVVLDTETGGLCPGWHEVIEIAIIPLNDDYTPNDKIPMFHTAVRPEYPERVDIGALIANGRVDKTRKDKDVAMAEAMELIMQYPERRDTIKAFLAWHGEFVKPISERMSWLAHNGSFDLDFLCHWFLPSHANGLSFKNFFNYQGRDTQRIVMYLQDRAKANNLPMPFPGVSLEKVAKHFGIEHDAHKAVGDSLATARVYRKLLGYDRVTQ